MKNIDIKEIEAFLYKEGRLLDEKKWDEWLDQYDESVDYWVPSWDIDGTLITDPQKEVSLMYYPNREGLEDRVFRINTNKSSACEIDTRTSHNINNVEIISQEDDILIVEFNWITYSQRFNKTYTHFGRSTYNISIAKDAPKITKKYVVLKNDFIQTATDIFHF